MKKSLGARLKELFSRASQSEEFRESLEDLLVEADLGAGAAMEAVDQLDGMGLSRGDLEAYRSALKDILSGWISTVDLDPDPAQLTVFLVLGVNGVGKTTSIAKLARRFSAALGAGMVVMSAADTFRAAAIDQLALHGERLGVRVVSQGHGSDPAAVIFDTIESAKARGERVVLADTAGRMHTKDNLVRELAKIHKVIRGREPDAVVKNVLVVDGTTGQNALRQAEIFHEAVGVDALILSKYDSAAKGGVAIAISRTLDVPIAYLGMGEGYEDLRPFDKEAFLEALLAGE